MQVLFLDDDTDILTDGLADLDESELHVLKCTSIDAAKAALTAGDGTMTGDDVMMFVDHDLGGGQEGYTLVEWVRRHHPRGHILPIVYLTGRESERGFIVNQAANPYHAPTLYLSKRDFARTSFDVNTFIAQLAAEYRIGVAEVDGQRLDASIRFLETLPDDVNEMSQDD